MASGEVSSPTVFRIPTVRAAKARPARAPAAIPARTRNGPTASPVATAGSFDAVWSGAASALDRRPREKHHGDGDQHDGRHLRRRDPFAQHDPAEDGAGGEHHAHLKRPRDADAHDRHRPHHEHAAQLRDEPEDDQRQHVLPRRQRRRPWAACQTRYSPNTEAPTDA